MEDAFKLSPEEHASIFHQEIEPYALGYTQAVERPTLTIVGAQPGAGKSKIVDSCLRSLSGNAVKINVDDLRRFHPKRAEIRRLDDKRYGERTQADAGAWVNELIDSASAKSRNIVLETAMRNPEQICQIIDGLKERAYQIKMCFVATPECISASSIYERYEGRKASESGYGRWIPIELHQQACKGVIETARMTEENRLAQSITVFDRHGAPLYENELASGEWRKDPLAVGVIKAERSRALTAKELEDFNKSWEKIFEHLAGRQAPPGDIEKAKEAFDNYLRDIGKLNMVQKNALLQQISDLKKQSRKSSSGKERTSEDDLLR